VPGSPGCVVVITSRDQLAGLVAAEGARLLPLDILANGEARELLAARLGWDRVVAEPAAVAELIRQSARLPLALSMASARAVTRPSISLAALSDELRDARVRLDALDAEDVATDLRAVFSWSLAWLGEQAARMFRLLGVVPGPDVSVPVAASLAGIPVEAARSALAELSRASLLTRDAHGRFSCHDLLRAYAGEQARALDGDAEIDAAQRRLLDHYLRTAYQAGATAFPGRTRIGLTPALDGVTPERLDVYEDVVRWFQAEQKSLMAAIFLAGNRGSARQGDADRSFDAYCWQLAWSCASMLMRLGQWRDIVAPLRTGVASAERLGDPLARALMHYELGWACCCLGELDEADASMRRALEIATASGDQATAARAHYGLVLLLDGQGRHAEALPHAQEALRLRSSLGNQAAVAYAENVLGWIYANLGQHAEALRHCTRALDLHRESGSRSGIADTLDSIAFAFQGLGDHEQAIAHYQRAVVIFREIGDPRGEANSLTRLGDAQLAVGRRNHARANWQRALTLVASMPGGDSEQVRDRLAGV
jgi:tetratricopeptide (TPR) repeat protein